VLHQTVPFEGVTEDLGSGAYTVVAGSSQAWRTDSGQVGAAALAALSWCSEATLTAGQWLVGAVRDRREYVLAAQDSWRRYNSATIEMYLLDEKRWVTVIADTGAALSLFPKYTLSNLLTWQPLIRSDTTLRAANGKGIPVEGKVLLRFQLQGSDKIWEHEVEVVSSPGAPNILGVDFFSPKGALVDLGGNSIKLKHSSGSWEEIPMSVRARSSAMAAACAAGRKHGPEEEPRWKEGCGYTMRLDTDMALPPREPVMVELQAPQEHARVGVDLVWEPASMTASTSECNTGDDDQDFVRLRLTSTAILQPK
jgi:hypothetical protein